jgi:hypothetical protein
MYGLTVDWRVLKELATYPPKVYRQIAGKIFSLQFDPTRRIAAK